MGTDPAVYNEQLGISFTQNFTSLAYNVTAVEQADPNSKEGPAYLLNGLSNVGYWYQVGFSWNWAPGYSPGTGFSLNYEVFDVEGNTVFPPGGYGGLSAFSGPVNEGDTVLLSLKFSNTMVAMFAKDYNTGAYASEAYSAEGASYFTGQTSGTSNYNGYFTGLMTEWYHSAPFYGNVAAVAYSNPSVALTSAWMWMSEISCQDTSCSNPIILFTNSTSNPVLYTNPMQLQKFSSKGATEFSDAYKFITGPAYYPITVSYSVVGGGSGFLQPSFTYKYNGATTSVLLTQSPTVYQVDVGSSWSVTGNLSGSSETERWTLESQASGGVVTSAQSIDFAYHHQYQLFVKGGSGGSDGTGWYDSGSIATASSQGVYDRSAGSGQRVSSYAIDGTVTNVTPTVGLIRADIVMASSHEIVFVSMAQYQVELGSGAEGSLISITTPTISGDTSWYDAGTPVEAVFAYVWGSSGDQSRFNVVSYTLSGSVTELSRQDNGSFSVSLTLDKPQALEVKGVVQYLVSFSFTDYLAKVGITPTFFQANSTGYFTRLNASSFWVDEGTSIQIAKVVWEGLDVSQGAQNFSATSPIHRTIPLEILNAEVRVKDLFGLNIAGAKVQILFSNGTSVSRITGPNGTMWTGLFPSGNFKATVSYFGISTSLTGNAMERQNFDVEVPLSTATVVLIAGAMALAAIGAVFVSHRKRRDRGLTVQAEATPVSGSLGVTTAHLNRGFHTERFSQRSSPLSSWRGLRMLR
jgi:hypothetical protein